MTATCIACHAKVRVKKLKGKAPCCGYFNCLIKAAPEPRKKEKRDESLQA